MIGKPTHQLRWRTGAANKTAVAMKLAEIAPEHDARTWARIISGKERTCWPDSSEHMMALSRAWPEVLFALDRTETSPHELPENETPRRYFLGGKSQEAHMPEFDPARVS